MKVAFVVKKKVIPIFPPRQSGQVGERRRESRRVYFTYMNKFKELLHVPRIVQEHRSRIPFLISAMASQVALITAGSAGLGAATARLFASQGMRVVVNYSNNSARAESLVQELQSISPLSSESHSRDFIAIQGDLGKRDDIARLVDESVKAMGRLDVVFSNAGWTRVVKFLELDENVNEEDWDRCYLMNVKSHLWLCHASRRYLEETEGCFITTASCAGVKPSGSSLVRMLALLGVEQGRKQLANFVIRPTQLRKQRKSIS